MLDAVEERLARGEGSPGLARLLARAGITHLVVRNDLDTGAAGSTRSVLVRQALADSPGITRVADVRAELLDRRDRAARAGGRRGLTEPAPAIEVYAVADAAPRAWTAPLSSAVARPRRPGRGPRAGGPRAGRRPADGAAGRGPVGTGSTMVSDALVRRERNFGRIADATSAGLTPEDPLRLTPRRGTTPADQAGAESWSLRRRAPSARPARPRTRRLPRQPARRPAVGGPRRDR